MVCQPTRRGRKGRLDDLVSADWIYKTHVTFAHQAETCSRCRLENNDLRARALYVVRSLVVGMRTNCSHSKGRRELEL